MAVHLSEFDPKENKSQKRFLDNLFKTIVPRAEKEVQLVILSGAMGSGKSLAVQFAINLLMSDYAKLKVGVGRISVKDAKDTFFKEFKVMCPSEVLKRDNAESMEFLNNSEVKAVGWGDKNVRKIRSNNFHIFVLEEVTEDAVKDGTYNLNYDALIEVIGRTRNPNGPNIIFLITNPDDPEHWLYREYIEKAGYVDGEKTSSLNREDNVHLFYSITTDNPYLSEAYKNMMLKNMSPKQAQRYVYGRWVSLGTDGIYNEYKEEEHYHEKTIYKVNKSYPVHLSWDFNTAQGKPMSVCMFQYINDHFHFYDEVVIENSNTRGVLEELEERGFFKQFTGTQQLIINGDAAGWAKQSAGTLSDYGLIKQFIDHLEYKVNYKLSVPTSNPEVKARHKLVNIYLKNLMNEIRISVYPPLHDSTQVSTLHRGFKSTRLKKGSKYAEDDKNPNQHITTSAGYGIWDCTKKKGGIKVIKS